MSLGHRSRRGNQHDRALVVVGRIRTATQVFQHARPQFSSLSTTTANSLAAIQHYLQSHRAILAPFVTASRARAHSAYRFNRGMTETTKFGHRASCGQDCGLSHRHTTLGRCRGRWTLGAAKSRGHPCDAVVPDAGTAMRCRRSNNSSKTSVHIDPCANLRRDSQPVMGNDLLVVPHRHCHRLRLLCANGAPRAPRLRAPGPAPRRPWEHGSGFMAASVTRGNGAGRRTSTVPRVANR